MGSDRGARRNTGELSGNSYSNSDREGLCLGRTLQAETCHLEWKGEGHLLRGIHDRQEPRSGVRKKKTVFFYAPGGGSDQKGARSLKEMMPHFRKIRPGKRKKKAGIGVSQARDRHPGMTWLGPNISLKGGGGGGVHK